ncbi:MAG: hypothetical protein WKG06_30270 [Segetibacter sp.]
MYSLLRNILFNFDAEDVHYFSMNTLKSISKVEILQKLLAKSFQYHNPLLEKQVFGLPFKNPVGLGAGFDKNALFIKELATIGFGFVEIRYSYTITTTWKRQAKIVSVTKR